jgi:hypothetical protein
MINVYKTYHFRIWISYRVLLQTDILSGAHDNLINQYIDDGVVKKYDTYYKYDDFEWIHKC